MTKAYDLAVKTGSYIDREGNTKNRYKNIGIVKQGENGMYMLLDRTFNPAGVPNPDDKDMVMVSMFEPKEDAPASNAEARRTAHNKRPVDPQAPDFDDSVPF